ncbi:MAG: CarD family transcriptional regulator [Lachnospiraceae bacterium]|nr:CarD family transcriptional regulator [Lachnospiraceae bacterium]
MYRIGDTVLYGTDGVCEITDIVSRQFNGTARQFYVLKPIYRKNAVLYLPTDNDKTMEKLRYVLTRDEILAAIRRMPELECIWIEHHNDRKDEYQSILRSGDATRMVQLIKTLYERRQILLDSGKKLRAADETCLKDAERLLYEEFSYVLEIPCSEVIPFIRKELGQ